MNLSETAEAKTRRPNVLLIVTDDQGYGDFGCTGNPWLKTPALDDLQADAVRLQQFHTDPMCAPSRAALLTGQYSARAGVWSTLTGRYFLNRDLPTMADLFRGAGYRTGHFGKWHLGDSASYLPHDRGFDETLYHGGGVIGEMPDHWDNDYFNAVFRRNGQPERFADTYCTNVWFNEAAGFIERSAAADTPFFCYLAANAPHTPHDVHARYAQPYLDQGLPPERAKFFGMIANLDENVARLRSRLETLGLADNTVIIYMGDNGTAGGAEVDGEGYLDAGYNAGMRGKKCWAFDGGHRNLCMVHWPNGGWSGGRDVNELTAIFDLLPTFTASCGLAESVESPPTFDGRDLSTLLAGRDDSTFTDRTLVVHNQQRDNPEKYKDFSVMTPQWRLTQTNDWGPGRRELTSANDDPGQARDVSAEHPEVVERLMGVYESWWEELTPAFDQMWPFYLSNDLPETMMTAHAWHAAAGRGIYDQNHCRKGVVQDGYWLIEVLDAGDYIFELRRWPREANATITAGLPARTGVPHVSDRPAGVALDIQSIRFTVTPDLPGAKALADEVIAVGSNDSCVRRQCSLQPGRYRVQATMTDRGGVERGAYYAYAGPT
ncbi:MAG: arylsulfatase [Planctomycetota bacterium]